MEKKLGFSFKWVKCPACKTSFQALIFDDKDEQKVDCPDCDFDFWYYKNGVDWDFDLLRNLKKES